MSNFYATYDLMEICTLINLVALASEMSNSSIDSDDLKLSCDEFSALVNKLYRTVDLLKKWSKCANDDDDDDENVINDQSGEDSDAAIDESVCPGVIFDNTTADGDVGDREHDVTETSATGTSSIGPSATGTVELTGPESDKNEDEMLNFYYGVFNCY